MSLSTQSEHDRLTRLTERAEPGNLPGLLTILTGIKDHANERALFYASADMRALAEDWSELATETSYRIEKIEADEWGWK